MALDTLPAELITIIAASLSVPQLSRLAATCRSLFEVCNRILYETEIRQQTFSSAKTSCLLWAAREGRLGTIQKAVQYGANVTGPPREFAAQTFEEQGYRGREVYTTLYYAIIGEQYEMAKYLLNNGYDLHTPVLATYRHRKRLATGLVDDQDDSTSFDTDSHRYNSDYTEISTLVSSRLSRLPIFRRTVRTGNFESSPARTISTSNGTRSDAIHAYYRLHFPLLLALDREATHGDSRIAEMIIEKGGFLVRPGTTALAYNIIGPAKMPQPAASDRMRRLLAQSPKVVEGDHGQHGRTSEPYPKGVAQTDEQKLQMLKLLCGGAKHRFYEYSLSPLAYSAWIGRPDLVQLSLGHFEDDIRRNDLWQDHDALSLAVLSGSIPTVELILKRINTQRAVTMRSLRLAAKSDNERMLPFLFRYRNSIVYLRKAADFGKVIGALSDMGRTEMLRDILDLARLRDKHLEYVPGNTREAFYRAAATHNIGCLDVLMGHRPIAEDSARLRPQTALHYACHEFAAQNASGIIQLLVRHGVSIDARRPPGTPPEAGFLLSPLQYALYIGNMHFACALLEFDSNLKSKPTDPIPLLHFAILGCKRAKIDTMAAAEAIKSLIRRGENIDGRAECASYDIALLRPFVAPSDLKILRDWRCPPLLFASLYRAPLFVIDALISGGADIEAATQYHNRGAFSPLNALFFLRYFNERGGTPIIQRLVHAGARLDDRHGSPWGSALDRACRLSRAVDYCCMGLGGDCDSFCRLGQDRTLNILMGYATKDNLNAEHVLHNLDNYYVKGRGEGEGEGEGRWVSRSSRPLGERDASLVVNTALRDFLRVQYPEFRHHHMNGPAYMASRLLGLFGLW